VTPGKFIFSALLLLVLVAPGTVVADPARDAADAVKRGDVNDAEKMLRAALAEAEQLGPDDPRLGGALENLAAFHEGLSENDKAEPLYLRALKVFERALGDTHPRFITSLNFVGSFYEQSERYDESARYFARALSATEGWVGPDHSVTSGALTKLANIYRMGRRFAKAEPLYLRAIAIREGEATPVRLRRTLGYYAELLRATGRDAEASKIAARAKALAR